MVGPVFTFGRRGGSNRNLVGMSESINNTSFRGVVRRHLHSHPITDCKPDETFAHLSGNVRENKMIVRKCDAEHGSGQHHHDGALQYDGFFRIHDIRLGLIFTNCGVEGGKADARLHKRRQLNRFTSAYQQTSAFYHYRREGGDALRADALR